MSGNRFWMGLKRVVLASLASLMLVFLIFAIPSTLDGLLTMSIHPVLHGVGLGFFALVYSFFVIVLWGIPIHLCFLYLGIKRVWHYLISGFLGGPLFLIFIRPFGVDPLETLIRQIAIVGGLGLLVSFVFWYVAVNREESV